MIGKLFAAVLWSSLILATVIVVSLIIRAPDFNAEPSAGSVVIAPPSTVQPTELRDRSRRSTTLTASDTIAGNPFSSHSLVKGSPFAVLADEVDLVDEVDVSRDPTAVDNGYGGAAGGVDSSIVRGIEFSSDSAGFEHAVKEVELAGYSANESDHSSRDDFDSWNDAHDSSVLLGSLVTSDGDPVSNHVVELYGSNPQGRIASVTTDSKGRFVFSALAPDEYLLQTQSHPFLETAHRRVRTGGAMHRIEIAFVNAVNVTGTVTDSNGAPLSGVFIVPPLDQEPAISDRDGRFAFRTTATVGEGLRFRFSAAGYLPTAEYVSGERWHPRETLDLTVVLRKGMFELAGTVVDQFGAPVPSALIQVTSRSENLHLAVRTNRLGEFLMNQVVPAEDYEVRATASTQYVPHVESGVSLSYGMSNLLIEMTDLAHGSLNGAILDEEGNPVPAFNLLVSTDGKVGQVRTLRTDDNGSYELQNFPAGTVSMRSRSEPRISIQEVVIEPGQMTLQDFVVDVGRNELLGLVQADDGQPVSTATVEMLSERRVSGRYKSIASRSRSTDNEGKFRFTGLGPGVRRVTVSADGFASVTRQLDPAMESVPGIYLLSRLPQP